MEELSRESVVCCVVAGEYYAWVMCCKEFLCVQEVADTCWDLGEVSGVDG